MSQCIGKSSMKQRYYRGKGNIQYCITECLYGEAQISWDTSLYTFNYPAQQGFFILLCVQWSHFDKDHNWIKRRLHRNSCQWFFIFFLTLSRYQFVCSREGHINCLIDFVETGRCMYTQYSVYGWLIDFNDLIKTAVIHSTGTQIWKEQWNCWPHLLVSWVQIYSKNAEQKISMYSNGKHFIFIYTFEALFSCQV